MKPPTRAELIRRVEALQATPGMGKVPANIRQQIMGLLSEAAPAQDDSLEAQVVRLVKGHPGLTVSALARMRGGTPSTTSRLITKMERRGLVMTILGNQKRYVYPVRRGRRAR